MLGDAYGAAIVEALSKKELEAMDIEKQKEMEKEQADLESAQALLHGSKSSGSMVKAYYLEDETLLWKLYSLYHTEWRGQSLFCIIKWIISRSSRGHYRGQIKLNH